mmetsp:Transcript_8274/g.21798  ORF Transcript_8274/g.21798 Transcript_8274/m.21798 type:complete len:146 (+) Transcript_8274:137-574(+)
MLASGLAELDWGGDQAQKDKKVTIGVQMQPLQLSMTVASEDMGCEMVFPHDALIVCHVGRALEFSYRFALLRMALKSLQEAEEACLQLDLDGLLDLKIKFANAQFVQFFVQPLLEEEDDDGLGPEPIKTPAANLHAQGAALDDDW